jgi:hypothetical protein
MIRTIFIAGLVVSAVILYAFGNARDGFWGFGKRGSGVEKTEQRVISSFDKLDVSGAFTVEFVSAEQTSVEITADDNLLADISTDVRGSTLYIETTRNLSPRGRLLVRVSSPQISSIRSSGASDISAANISSDKLTIETSGAGSVKASVQTSLLKLETSGAGNVALNGSAETFIVETSGAADVKARNLNVKKARLEVSGAGEVELNVSDELDVSVSGAGDIRYFGSPSSVRQDISGAGSVRKIGDKP